MKYLFALKNLFALLILVGVAAPFAVHVAVSSYQAYQVENMRHRDLKRQQRQIHEYAAQVKEYEQFAARVEKFIGSAQLAGIAEDAWDKHHVDIKNRTIEFAGLDQFLGEAGGGKNYYFLPEKLKILSPGAKNSSNPFKRGRANVNEDQVLVSLTGDYLVRVK